MTCAMGLLRLHASEIMIEAEFTTDNIAAVVDVITFTTWGSIMVVNEVEAMGKR